MLNNRLVTSAASFGRLVTDVNLSFDQSNGTLASATANNIIVTNSKADGTADTARIDPVVKAIADIYRPAVNVLQSRIVGSITADITRNAPPSGESTLGDVIADSQLAATKDAATGGAAVLALMNPGGIRTDLTFLPASNRHAETG